MFLSYLRLTIRTFLKNQASFIINLLGMSIALGCSITAYVNYEYSAGFDKQQKNAANVYRISFWQQTEKKLVPYGICPMPVGNLIRENLPVGDQVIQYIRKGAQFKIKDEMFSKDFVYADPSFTEIFSMELLSGTLVLKDKAMCLSVTNWPALTLEERMCSEVPLPRLFQGNPGSLQSPGCSKPSQLTLVSDLIC